MGCGQKVDLLSLMSADHADAQGRLQEIQLELAKLEPLVLGQTATEMGAQHLMLTARPPQAPWVQLDLGESRKIDSVTLVPAILRFDETEPAGYAFPPRFRIDASDTEDFADFEPIFDSTEEDFESVRGLPLVIMTPDVEARFVRITVVRLAEVVERWTFALAEVIVISGNRNVAVGADVSMQGSIQLSPVWRSEYLVDGRTPLGPPLDLRRPESPLPRFDGVFCGRGDPSEPYGMTIDLETEYAIEEVRLFPVHARQGADYPGYAFPEQFRVELSRSPDFKEVFVLFDTKGNTFSNPGNNPVTLPARLTEEGSRRFRYVRFSCLKSPLPNRKYGLAELQVYAEGQNVALNKSVVMPRVLRERSPRLLVDGDASYGRIVELPDWIARWKRTRDLTLAASEQQTRLEQTEATARRRLGWLGGGVLVLSVAVGGVFASGRARQRRREQRDFRERLARDFHDEIGSNLAAIARIGEVAELEAASTQATSDWRSVRELSLECIDAMRDTLWLLGAKRATDEALLPKLRRIASRMLPNARVEWSESDEAWRGGNEAVQREVALVFKEVIANIARHADAERVIVTASRDAGRDLLVINDKGAGFDPAKVPSGSEAAGLGLVSMQLRMKKAGGSIAIASSPGEGTTVTIETPSVVRHDKQRPCDA